MEKWQEIKHEYIKIKELRQENIKLEYSLKIVEKDRINLIVENETLKLKLIELEKENKELERDLRITSKDLYNLKQKNKELEKEIKRLQIIIDNLTD